MTHYTPNSSASLRHEINNSLTLLSSRLQLLASKHPFLKKDPDFIEIRNDLSNIQRLLSYDRISHQPQLIPCRIQPLLDELYASFLPVFHSQKVELFLHIEPDLPLIRADLPLIRQAMINLLKNASEAARPGGHVTLSASFNSTHIILSVSDDGTGMTPEQQAHIFEPFVSYKKGGTGLGLAIVQSIISAHHGHLSLETSPGHGCTFRILLPVSLSPVEKSAK